MSDLFHKKISRSFVDQIFNTMEQANWHIFQILTKRSSLLRTYINQRYHSNPSPAHMWLGVSVEDRAALSRVNHLRQSNVAVRFLSIEPLLEDIGPIDLKGIHWVIVGGESGPKARPIKEKWVLSIRDQCQKAKIPFFFKQWGGRTPKARGRLLEGNYWDEMPHVEQPLPLPIAVNSR